MIVKSKRPRENLSSKSHFLIEFAFEYSHLKNLYRQGWLKENIPEHKCESVADHSFGVAILSMILCEEYFPELDISKVMKLALIHEVGEILAGDITPHDKITKEKKYEMEREAIVKIFEGFPTPKKYLSLWEEFEENKTSEAKFVKQIDKLEMVLQASVYERETKKDLNCFYESVKDQLKEPKVKQILDELVLLRDL